MPIKEVTYKGQLGSQIDSFLASKRSNSNPGKSEGDVEFLNILEYIEKFKLLPQGLYPVQKFILKLYYNIPLDDKEKVIRISDRFGTKTLFYLTETEYLEHLYKEGRCNVKVQDSRLRTELVLVLGRRSGKSAISSMVASYEAYKLLSRGHPQSYYGMPSGADIRIMAVANDKEQASIIYGDIQSHVESVDYFKSSLANQTQTFIRFRTENDKKKYGKNGKSTISVTFKSSIAKGLRGRAVICGILDEVAFFGRDGKASADEIYRALYPSTAQFSPRDPQDKNIPIGPTEGRMILISSPDAREGLFYDMHETGMSGRKGSENMLVIRAPTWEVNPTLAVSYYETEYAKNPAAFVTEHGAEFSDRVRGFIEDPKVLTDCINPTLMPQTRGIPREPHFAGLDFALVNDGTSISLTKIVNSKVELAYHEVWYAGVPWKTSNPHLTSPITPYAHKLQTETRLDMDEIVEWIHQLSKLFYIHSGIFDQWAGIVFEQVLHKKGLRQFSMKNFSTYDSSSMFQNFKMLMYNNQFSLYDYPSNPSDNIHSPLVSELLELQTSSVGKNLISVEAPKVIGKHDDMSDSLARSVMLASSFLSTNPGYGKAVSGSQKTVISGNYTTYQRQKARLHGSRRFR